MNAVLLISCPDKKGLVSAVSNFIFENNGNIIHADQHTDTEAGIFLQRIEWELRGFRIPRNKISQAFEPIARRFRMSWELHFSDEIPRLAILVSQKEHCLYDLLWRVKAGELKANIPLIISNHTNARKVAESFDIPFHHFPVTPKTKQIQEKKILEQLKKAKVNLVVLARYMQILSKPFVTQYPNRIINIHHSFLPAFAGGKPYHQAHQRGVKVIGATAHYITADLDQGPIIEQDVVRISHRESVSDLVRKGQDLEKIVLARSVGIHLRHQVMVYRNKTVVF